MNKKLILLSTVLLAAVAVGGCKKADQRQTYDAGYLTFFITEGDDYVIYRGLSDFLFREGQTRAFAVVFRPTVVPIDEHKAWGNSFSSNVKKYNVDYSIDYLDGVKMGYKCDTANGPYALSLNGQTVSLEKDFVYFMDGTTILRKVSYDELGLVFPTRNDEYCEKFKHMIEPAIRAYVETNSGEIFGVEITKNTEAEDE